MQHARCVVAALAAVVAMLAARPVAAAFHLMRIDEVLAQAGGDPGLQFVELEMTAAGQNLVGGHTLVFQDAAGNVTAEFEIPDDVSGADQGSRILFATRAFADAAGIEPDFELPEGLLTPYSGRVCFEDIDCVAYGDYTGDNGRWGSPAPRFPVTGVFSLRRTRTDSPPDNSTDFELGPPAPQNNAGEEGSLDADSGLDCFFEDDFDDLAHWDVPTPGEGLDLNGCGLPLVADVGTLDVEGGELLCVPGLEDQLELGNPICIASLGNAAARQIVESAPSESYRVRFDMLAEFGLVQAAFFVRQHGAFAGGVSDASTTLGAGFNVTFGCHREDAPEPCPDNASDHVHPDVRSNCLAELDFTLGPEDGLFNTVDLLEPETRYSMAIDVDGDDAFGPLTVQVKLWPAGEPEPPGYFVSWQITSGIDAPLDEELDRAFLVAALRSGGVEPGPVLRLSNFSVCAIPRLNRHVRFLECSREPNGDVRVAWDQPFGLEDDGETRVLLDGAEVGVVDADVTEFFIEEPPERDFEVAVINSSGVPVTCGVCLNDPPEVVIEGPERVDFEGVPVQVMLDSSATTDPDGSGELVRFWEVVESPEGIFPVVDDPGAESVRLTLEEEGEYVVALSVTDAGCPGDEFPLESTAEHRITVAEPVDDPGFTRGDCNASGGVDLSDAIFWLNFLFTGGDEPACREACNANGDGTGDLSDAVSLLNFLFTGGAPPPDPGPEACGAPAEPGPLGCEAPAC